VALSRCDDWYHGMKSLRGIAITKPGRGQVGDVGWPQPLGSKCVSVRPGCRVLRPSQALPTAHGSAAARSFAARFRFAPRELLRENTRASSGMSRRRRSLAWLVVDPVIAQKSDSELGHHSAVAETENRPQATTPPPPVAPLCRVGRSGNFNSSPKLFFPYLKRRIHAINFQIRWCRFFRCGRELEGAVIHTV
jgi:hypothetical protein